MDLGRDLGCFRAFGEYGDMLVGCISSSRLWDDCLCNCFIFCIFVSYWDWDWRSKYSIRYWLNETMADSYERSDEHYSFKWDSKFGRVRIVGEKLTEQWSYFISCRRRFQHFFSHKKHLWMKVSNQMQWWWWWWWCKFGREIKNNSVYIITQLGCDQISQKKELFNTKYPQIIISSI